MIDHSFLGFFVDADWVVRIVLLLLLVASVMSWTYIIQRGRYLKALKASMAQFQSQFSQMIENDQIFIEDHGEENEEQIDNHQALYKPDGMQAIYQAGLKEYQRLQQRFGISDEKLLAAVERAMRVELAKQVEEHQQYLSFLATVGSTSPYVGLFGTVWGIMTSFQSLGHVQQATIAMVAPGISEALIATAMGLFAAIPAVIFYNRYTNEVERIANHYETFQDEFCALVERCG